MCFQDESNPGDALPTSFTLPTYHQETLRHILLGDYGAIIDAINHMASLGYGDKTAWSPLIPSGRSGEYIAVMTRRRGTTR